MSTAKFRKLIYWDNSLEPPWGYVGTSTNGVPYAGMVGVESPYPTMPLDWIDVTGVSKGLCNITMICSFIPGDAADIAMTIYRHANSSRYKFYLIYLNTAGIPMTGYECSILSMISSQLDEGPDVFEYVFQLRCFGRLMSYGRDYYLVNKEENQFGLITPWMAEYGSNFRNI